MSAATMEASEQRLTTMEQRIAVLEQQVQAAQSGWKSTVGTFKDDSLIVSAARSGRNRSESLYLGNQNENPQAVSHYDRIMALRAKLKPISQEDADMINSAIMEAREASIVQDPPA